MFNECLTTLTVVYRRWADLQPYERNARTHSKAQIRKIADSIKAFGFTNPVLLDSRDMIVAGHGRVAAAKLLGMEQVPTILVLENEVEISLTGFEVPEIDLILGDDDQTAEPEDALPEELDSIVTQRGDL